MPAGCMVHPPWGSSKPSMRLVAHSSEGRRVRASDRGLGSTARRSPGGHVRLLPQDQQGPLWGECGPPHVPSGLSGARGLLGQVPRRSIDSPVVRAKFVAFPGHQQVPHWRVEVATVGPRGGSPAGSYSSVCVCVGRCHSWSSKSSIAHEYSVQRRLGLVSRPSSGANLHVQSCGRVPRVPRRS